MVIDVCIIAGEASGDLQASLLLQQLLEKARHQNISLQTWGAGGQALSQLGMEIVAPVEQLNVMGFFDVLQSYGTLSPLFQKLRAQLHRRKPKIVILVDYPGFNLRFAQEAAALGSLVVWHIAPKVWAHGSARIKTLKFCVDLLTCLLPFEEAYFKNFQIPAFFVGNPLKDAIEKWKLHAISNPYPDRVLRIGLLPGSRKSELKNLLALMLKSLQALSQLVKNKQLPYDSVIGLLPVASTLSIDFVQDQVKLNGKINNLSVEIVYCNSTYEALYAANYAWVCSGTATLEAALMGTPFAVVYSMSKLNYEIAKRIVQLPYVSLANLSAQEAIVAEYIQEEASVANLTQNAVDLLSDAAVSTQLKLKLSALSESFPKNSAELASHLIWNAFLNSPFSQQDNPNPWSQQLKIRAERSRLF